MIYIPEDKAFTMSQVIDLFEKRNIYFTKTTIQNYVRVGVLPPPLNKRYYVKKHLVLLSLLKTLKTVYSLDEIKKVFEPILRSPNTFDDDIIDIVDIEAIYSNFCNKHIQNLKNDISKISSETIDFDFQIPNNPNLDEYKDDIQIFLERLNIMSLSVCAKQILQENINLENIELY